MGSRVDPVPVAIALGSNLGDRRCHLDEAIHRLSSCLHDIRVSSRYDTEPVGVSVDQPRFLNAVAIGLTHLPADELLTRLLAIETDLGRTRPHAGAPRTVDLDLILYGDLVTASQTLTVPHPRFRTRAFVLEPLAEVAPDWRDPVSGATVATLLARLHGR